MLQDSFDRAFKRMKEKNWEKIYVLVDIHDTIMESSYDNKNEKYKFFENAIKCLNLMSKTREIYLILWTSTYQEEIWEYLNVMRDNGIFFDSVNKNKEVQNNSLSCFSEKLYFNVGIDDKFGFNADTDWESLFEYLTEKHKEGVISFYEEGSEKSLKQIEQAIFTKLMAVPSQRKSDILGNDAIEDVVFTKKLSVGVECSQYSIQSIAMTSYDQYFTDARALYIRVNMKNAVGSWCNLYLKDLSEEMIRCIAKALKI